MLKLEGDLLPLIQYVKNTKAQYITKLAQGNENSRQITLV